MKDARCKSHNRVDCRVCTIEKQVAALAKLPTNARELFVKYVQDAGNWNGTPLVGSNVTLLGEKEDRGLLTYLKRAGLVTTSQDADNRKCFWLHFTPDGVAYAKSLGHDTTNMELGL